MTIVFDTIPPAPPQAPASTVGELAPSPSWEPASPTVTSGPADRGAGRTQAGRPDPDETAAAVAVALALLAGSGEARSPRRRHTLWASPVFAGPRSWRTAH